MVLHMIYVFNPFLFVLLTLPLSTIFVSVVVTKISRKFWVAPLLSVIILILMMIFVFNDSFFMWVIVNTIISLITSLISYVGFEGKNFNINK